MAEAGRAVAGTGFRDSVDVEVAAFWRAVSDHARGREAEARTTELVVRAGLAAAPYLLRQDTAVATRALDARAGKVSIPAALWLAIGLRRWLADVVAGVRGDEAAAARAREVIEKAAEDPDAAPLADVVGRILDGERDPALGTGLDDPTDRAVVATVLQHIGS